MQHAYTIAFLLILCSFLGYSIGKIYGFAILPDEFGYWFYAAAAAGYDWSEIASLNGYYSYGYGIILAPVFILFRDGLTAYRAAVAVNFILLAGTGLMLRYLAGRLFIDTKGKVLAFFAMAAALYPPLLLYGRTTMAETMLVFLYVLSAVLLYQYLENRRVSVLFLLSAVLIYMHFVHMRTVSMLAAGVLSAIIDRLFFAGKSKRCRYDRKYPHELTAVAAALVLFILGMSVRSVILDFVYEGRSELFWANDYRGQFGKMQYLMTLEGMKGLAVSIVGKALYLGSASFGTAFWGIWHAWKAVIHGRERKRRVFWCFVLLSAAGALAVSAVYTIYPGRADALAYGRYHEYVFPILMIAGLYEMWHSHRLWSGMVLTAGLELCMVVPVLCSLYKHRQTSLHACMVLGMSYLYDAGNSEPVKFYLAAYGFGILLLLVVTALIAVGRRQESWMILLFFIAVMEILLAARASAAVLEPGSIGAYRDSVVAGKITELVGDTDDGGEMSVRKVLYLNSGGDSSIGMIQFLLRDTRIGVLDKRKSIEDYSEDEMGAWDLVLTDYKDDYGRELCRKYACALSSGHFILYYNRTGADL